MSIAGSKPRRLLRTLSEIAEQKKRPAFSRQNRDLTGKKPPGVERAEGRIVRAGKGVGVQRSGSYERKPARDNDLLYEGDTVNSTGKDDAVVKRRGGKRFSIGKMGMTKVGR